MPGKPKRPDYDYIRDNNMREFLFVCQTTNSIPLLDYWLTHRQIDVNDYQGSREIVPLMSASAFNNKVVCEYLLEKGANINMIDFHGDTSLVYAIRRGHLDLARWLIEKGSSFDLENTKGQTAIDILQWEYQKRKDDKYFDKSVWIHFAKESFGKNIE